jgi:hypothetical protein
MKSIVIKSFVTVSLLGVSAAAFASSCCGDLACCLQMLACCWQ